LGTAQFAWQSIDQSKDQSKRVCRRHLWQTGKAYSEEIVSNARCCRSQEEGREGSGCLFSAGNDPNSTAQRIAGQSRALRRQARAKARCRIR
jgi:hypothetical protein